MVNTSTRQIDEIVNLFARRLFIFSRPLFLLLLPLPLPVWGSNIKWKDLGIEIAIEILGNNNNNNTAFTTRVLAANLDVMATNVTGESGRRKAEGLRSLFPGQWQVFPVVFHHFSNGSIHSRLLISLQRLSTQRMARMAKKIIMEDSLTLLFLSNFSP